MTDWQTLQSSIINCERCPRLREHCQKIAREKRAAFRACTYWGKPIPNLGEPSARLLIVGLAPAAHGANRTGRMFTGDRSGEFLFRALYETGFANQPTCADPEDGLRLIDVAITAVAHCAPPENKPSPVEIANCAEHLDATVAAMPNLYGVIALGRIAFDACIRLYRKRAWLERRQSIAFGHGASYRPATGPFLLASFHPSQQNTFTGRLTPAMMRSVFETAKENLLNLSAPSPARRAGGGDVPARVRSAPGRTRSH